MKLYIKSGEDIERYDKDVKSYKLINRKSIEDFDGFYTDYCLYSVEFDNGDTEYECYFGDRDVYGPWNGDGLDFESDELNTALEWFYNYSTD